MIGQSRNLASPRKIRYFLIKLQKRRAAVDDLNLVYVVKVMILSDLQQVLAVARHSLKLLTKKV